MRAISITIVLFFLMVNIGYCKTLVKYNKNTGDIIQTNNVDKMPSQDIIADRFKSATTDVLLVDETVNIATQRVDLNEKKIIDIPKKELDDRAKELKDAKDKKDADRQKAIEKLKAVVNLTDEEVKVLFNE